MTFPQTLDIDEAGIKRLITFYQKAEKKIIAEMAHTTNFGLYNRKVLLTQVDAILKEFNTKANEFIKEEIPTQYNKGTKSAVDQLEEVGAKVKVKSVMTTIDKASVQLLVSETQKAFADSMITVSRSANSVVSTAVKEQIKEQLAYGNLTGTTLKKIQKDVIATFTEKGLSGLVDKAGHSWSLDRYTEMLIRTKAVEARNRGTANRMLQNGYDLVQVTNHGSDHEECAYWEGKILSLTGRTKGYPTIADAERGGLFHPNCKHSYNVLIPELAEKTGAYNLDD